MHESTRRELQDELIRYARTVNRLRQDNAMLLRGLRSALRADTGEDDNQWAYNIRDVIEKTLKEYGGEI